MGGDPVPGPLDVLREAFEALEEDPLIFARALRGRRR